MWISWGDKGAPLWNWFCLLSRAVQLPLREPVFALSECVTSRVSGWGEVSCRTCYVEACVGINALGVFREVVPGKASGWEGWRVESQLVSFVLLSVEPSSFHSANLAPWSAKLFCFFWTNWWEYHVSFDTSSGIPESVWCGWETTESSLFWTMCCDNSNLILTLTCDHWKRWL